MDRNAIHDMTLRARILLTGEARELLEGVYGLHSDGHFEAAEHLPAVQELEEVRKTRERLESFLADEVKAGLTRREAVDKLVKEVAFTHLNRLVAFKMMESRKLVRGTIDRYHDSNDFLFYLAEDEHADDMARYEQGSLPQNALGEGPRDIAYRHFLLWQSAQMAREIKVLFDPDNLPSSLFPRPRALRELIEMLNAPKLQDAWAPGEEETIGWIYQYFNEPDVEIFKGKAAMKVPPSLIAPKTQLFTPRWIVKLLVHNTLGRLWMQMHPDSRLIEKLDYLVPADDIPSTEQKLARDITLLDPACGTMHFGLVAFDLFVDMYKEEISKAGEHGWPVKPSVEQESDIPSSILANNIYGIDIDLRAVHLSALTLFLRAKTYNPSVRIRESNLANADVLLLNGARLESFLEDMAFTQPVYSRVIKALWSHLKDAGQLGTLLRLDKQIELLVSEEKTA
ncbi:MAG TPA: SAM-dependent methyltransferase, partial [Armatimonadota bacterium]|nr:SAM-dependent methyltransferase [Armatimonadota bacterium]